MTPATRDGRQPLERYTPAASVGPARVVPNAPGESSIPRARGTAADMLALVLDHLRESEGMDFEGEL